MFAKIQNMKFYENAPFGGAEIMNVIADFRDCFAEAPNKKELPQQWNGSPSVPAERG
jgi:hypothetical protein